MLAIWAGGTTLPSLSVIRKFTVGFCPGPVLLKLMRSNFGRRSCSDLYSAMWEPAIEASYSNSPSGLWQRAHCASFGEAPAAWPAPVAKLTSSWHEPQAARVGLSSQLFTWIESLWQVAQLRRSCGNPTV